MADGSYTPDEVRQRLAHLDQKPRRTWHSERDFAHRDLSESAVLIPLTERDGELHVLFTQRSHELRTHSGEVSFPGGRREPEDDSLTETALREAYEEIALVPGDVEVFGALTRIPTITGFQVTAFVGEYPSPYEIILNPDEIHLIFVAPLRELADPAIHRLERREFDGEIYPVHFFDWNGHVIWGATGFLLATLLDYLLLDHGGLLDYGGVKE
jgi:8-oxo-dGTP pyrophosphatase MutT (NUDIX family)